MRNPKRISRILDKLERLWKEHPDQRLGQLLENYVFTEGERGDKTSFKMYIQDDTETEQIIEENINEEEKEGQE